ncbi:MAG: hypothetical protein GYB67_07490, partial [Chloroflexi bacterium]|nr:hypothetical protein [Chloroflexota bacterium]
MRHSRLEPSARWRALMLLITALILLSLPIFGVSAQGTTPVINEFVANHTSTDTNEYIEVFGAANTDYSAFTLLEIEGD